MTRCDVCSVPEHAQCPTPLDPNCPCCQDTSENIALFDAASAKPATVTMTSPDGTTTTVTRTPLRDVFCTKCGVSVGEDHEDHVCNGSYETSRDNSRGFSRGEYVQTYKGCGRWRLRESSNAMVPCLWLDVAEPPDLNDAVMAFVTGGEVTYQPDQTIQLSAVDARQLRDALDEMLRDHYQGDFSMPGTGLEDEDD